MNLDRLIVWKRTNFEQFDLYQEYGRIEERLQSQRLLQTAQQKLEEEQLVDTGEPEQDFEEGELEV